jgi:hypothetical protein
MKMELQIKMA